MTAAIPPVSGSAIDDGSDPASNLRRLLEQLPPAARPGRPVPATPLNPRRQLRRKNMTDHNARQIIPPPTPMKITQIAVVVRDMEAALKSYTETLGWGPWSVFDYKPPLLHDTRVHGEPVEVVTGRAPALQAVIDEVIPAAFHNVEQYANNRVECDHGRLKARLRPMRGLKRDRTARVIVRGHALIQNLRRGHYELGLDVPPALRVAAAFTELAQAI